MITYEIVHIHPDKSEEVIKVVTDTAQIPLITEQPKYLGTWIKEDRKILRWAKGEILIRTIEHLAKVTSMRVLQLGTVPLYELTIENHHELKTICLSGHTIVGYDSRLVPLWQTNSFTKLADIVSKSIAYECHQYYEQYLEAYKIEGAM